MESIEHSRSDMDEATVSHFEMRKKKLVHIWFVLKEFNGTLKIDSDIFGSVTMDLTTLTITGDEDTMTGYAEIDRSKR